MTGVRKGSPATVVANPLVRLQTFASIRGRRRQSRTSGQSVGSKSIRQNSAKFLRGRFPPWQTNKHSALKPTAWGRSRCPPTTTGARRPSARCMHFDIGARPHAAPIIHAFGILKKARRRTSTRTSASSTPTRRELIVQAADEVDRRQARRPVSAARLADRQRHADQHERQRGDLEPRDRNRRRRAGRQEADPSERRRQHVAVLQRHVSRPRCTSPRPMEITRPAHARRAEAARRARTPRPRSSRGIVKIGRTHLMDATPLTLGQEFSGYVAQLDFDLERIEAVLPDSTSSRSAARRSAPASTRIPSSPSASRDEDRRAHRPAVRHGAEQVRRARRARRARDGQRRAEDARRSLMKIANDIRWLGSGPRCGLGELHPARERAGLVDHAGQGQPDAVRGDDDGLRAGDRQRHRDRDRRRAGQLRAQRLQAGDHPQLAALDRACWPTRATRSPSTASSASSPNRERIAQLRRRLADAGHRAQPAHRLRQGRQGRQEGA